MVADHAPPPGRCEWREIGGRCQFSTLNPIAIQTASGVYCPLHVPTTEPQWNATLAYNCFVDSVNHGIKNFDGCNFPHDKELRPSAAAGETVSFRDCTFLGKSTLNLTGVKSGATTVLGTPKTMGGELAVLLSYGKLLARSCKFSEMLLLAPQASADIVVDLTKSRFLKGVQVKGPMEGVWTFAQTKFDGVFTFQARNNSERPSSKKANIDFFRSCFTKSATPRHAEGLYRDWREWFSEIGDKDNEAFFYALEKRSQRRGLPLGLTRGFSASYDALSGYGQSFVRPLMWFFLAQFIAGIVYAWRSPFFDIRPAADATIPAFTLAQLAKPFELLGLRLHSELVVSVIGNNVAPGWALGTFVHSIVSLFLLTLFVLALRWRFRRS